MIEGVLTDRERNALAGYEVRLTEAPEVRALTDQMGRFTLEGKGGDCTADSVSYVVYQHGVALQQGRARHEQAKVLEISLLAAQKRVLEECMLEGILLDEEENGLGGYEVRLGGDPKRVVTTEFDGGFDFIVTDLDCKADTVVFAIYRNGRLIDTDTSYPGLVTRRIYLETGK